jgi:hypothetical protein
MFSQLSDFTSFASKLTAELSLDNLQKEEEVTSSSKKSSPCSLPSASLASALPVTIPGAYSSLKKEDEKKSTEYESSLHDKDLMIESLHADLSICQVDLLNARKLMEKEKERSQSLENKVHQHELAEHENLQRYQLLQARNKDLELELTDLQLHYQSKFTAIENQVCSSPCVACIALQGQVDEMTSAHQAAVDNLNKKILKIQKQNKKLEKDLQDSLQKNIRLEATSLLGSPFPAPEIITTAPPVEQQGIDTSRDEEIQMMQTKIDEIQRSYNELKEKQQVQTSKMKEKVKEFIESQKLLQGEKSELANLLSAKVCSSSSLSSFSDITVGL